MEVNSEVLVRGKSCIETSSGGNWDSCVWRPAKVQNEDGAPFYTAHETREYIRINIIVMTLSSPCLPTSIRRPVHLYS